MSSAYMIILTQTDLYKHPRRLCSTVVLRCQHIPQTSMAIGRHPAGFLVSTERNMTLLNSISHMWNIWQTSLLAILLLTSFYIAASKEYLTKIQIIYRYVASAFPQLYCLKCSFKSVHIMQEHKSGCFFETQCKIKGQDSMQRLGLLHSRQ